MRESRKYLIFTCWPKIKRKYFPRLIMSIFSLNWQKNVSKNWCWPKKCKISLNWQKIAWIQLLAKISEKIQENISFLATGQKLGEKTSQDWCWPKNCKILLNWQKSPNSTDGQNLRENTRQHLIFSYWSKVERKYFPRLMLAKKLQNLTQLAENSSNSTAGQTLRQNTRT